MGRRRQRQRGLGAGTFVNNVFVDGHNRSILAKGDTQFINNTIYNYQAAFTSGNSAGTFRYDVIGNYFITGPSTTSASNDYYQVDSNQSAYATGNIRDSNNDGTLNGSGSNTLDSAIVLGSPWSTASAQLPQLSAAASYAWNIAHAGVSIKHDVNTFVVLAGYDAVDAQMMTNVQTLGTAGRLWSSESQTGLANSGLGTLNAGVSPTDTDHDGIPDAWETAHGMNINSASDALLLSPLGYRMVEQYANELVRTSNDSRTWSAVSGNWTTPANWTGSTLPGPFEYISVRGTGVASGAVTVSSGTATAMTLSIGGNGPIAGEKVTVSGGSMNVYDTITVGDQNNATLQINGGTVQAYNVVLGDTVYSPSATDYTGTLNLAGGTLAISQLVLGAGTPSNWTTGGSMNWSGGMLKAIAQLNVNVPLAVSATGGTVDTNGFNGNISSVISGVGGIAKLGAGTLTLSGASSYTGVTKVQTGTLAITALSNGGVNGNLGAAAVAAANLILDGGTLQYVGNTSTATDRLFTLTANGGTLDSGGAGQFRFLSTDDIAQAGTGNRTLTLTGTSTTNDFYPGLGDPTGGGKTSLVKNGTGRWFLRASAVPRSYTGDTVINAGTLMAFTNNPLPFGTGKGNLIVNAGTFEMAGNNLSINGLSGAGGINQRNNGAKTLTIGNGDANGNFSGILSNVISGTGTAILNIVKMGAGTQILGGANTYVGATTVALGKLQLGANNTIPNTSSLVLTGGTFATGGFSDTLGSLTVTANSHLDLSTGASILRFSVSSGQTWSGTLTIDNWSGSAAGGGIDQIYVGANSTGLTASQLANIVFTGSGMLNSVLLPSGELVPGRTFVPGDFNRDNALSSADVQAMLSAMTDLSQYQADMSLSVNDLLEIGDLNGDGKLTNADIQALLELSANAGSGTTTAVPEPNAIILAVVLALASLAKFVPWLSHGVRTASE